MSEYTSPVRRINRGKSHSYVDANGLKVPGVTTVIGNGVPKPALINWAANTTADYAVDHWDELAGLSPSKKLDTLKKARFGDRDAAAKRGTEVHALAEKLVAGEEVEVPDELAGHVESYVTFLDDFAVDPVKVEFVIVSDAHGYAGTCDLIADFPTLGKRLLCDLKTNRSGVFGETALQLAAYRFADSHDGETAIEVDGCAVIHIRGDGCDLVPVQADRRQHRQFLYVQQVARFCEGSRDLVGEPILPPRLTEEMSA
jgi:hypothetical protein